MAGKRRHDPETAFYQNLGRMIRIARITAGKSQGEVSDQIDLTFQPLQKYEAGQNRIPIDKLVAVAQFLDVPVSYFIAPEKRSKADEQFFSLIDIFEAKEFASLLECWRVIEDKKMRAALLNLVRTMADLKR